MDVSTKKSVKLQLFIGFEMTIDLKTGLNQSNKWKQVSHKVSREERDLEEVQYKNRPYIGRYLDNQLFSMEEIRETIKKTRRTLESYCPKINADKLEVTVFSQVFVK